MSHKPILNILIVVGLLALPLALGRGQAAQAAPDASTLYVKPGAGGGCTSWGDACEMQAALSLAASGDEIWVAQGVYKPTTPSGRAATFQLKSGVELYGGFDPASGVDSFEERDRTENITVLSGDIDGNDITDPNGVVTDLVNIQGENAYHVVTGGGTDATALLDGFTITAGKADGEGNAHDGGGMLNLRGSPTVSNVIFTGNAASQGGGVHNWDNSPTLINVAFSGNSALVGSYLYHNGGGMFNIDSNPTLINVTFSGNSAVSGGGMYNTDNSSPTLTNAILWGNTPNQIASEPGSMPLVSFSDIQGGYAGEGNINADPLFVDDGGSNLRLRPFSPAVDAGDNAAVPPEITTDLDGSLRFVDVVAVLDTGNGELPIVDMGAYEARVIFVDEAASGDNDGTSWTDAFNALQAGLADAQAGNEIWVAQGMYIPTLGIPYASCQAIREADPMAQDGDYLIQNGGNAFQVYCDDMAGTPEEYLTLDSSVNYSQYTAGGVSPGTNVRSNYSKVRLLPDTLQVDISDQTFAVSSGSLMHSGNIPVTSMPYGVAMDCKISQTGVAHINLTGTSFAIDPAETFILAGSSATGSSVITDNRQVVSLQGGGFCGWIQPAPFIYNPINNAGGPILELEHILPERKATFQLKSGVALFGGFPAGGGDWERRDWLAYPTVLSGDIGTTGDSSDNAYHVVTGSAAGMVATLDGFTITGGNANGLCTGLCQDPFGGGVNNPEGALNIQNTRFAGNRAQYSGGGIANKGTLTVANSTFSVNEAGWGGGIANLHEGILTLLGSTVGPGNNVNSSGGGIYNDGEMVISGSTVMGNSGTGTVGGAGIANYGTLEITNTTISGNFTNVNGGGILHGWGSLILTNATITGNTADYNQDEYGSGAGMFIEYSQNQLSVKNTIIANNTGADCAGGTDWLLNSLGYNMDSDGTCQLTGTGDKPGTDPQPGPLADNGGPTLTHALRFGSPAIDAGDPLECPETDQRGMPRPVDGDLDGEPVCDMGAYEFQPPKLYMPLVRK